MDGMTRSLEAGKLADFIVLDCNLLNAPAEEAGKVQVIQTVIGGGTVYQASFAER